MRAFSLFVVIIACLAPVLPARALTISLVYQDPSDPFFTPAAQATLQQAANDVGQAITTVLAALPQESFTGTSGDTTVSAQWTLSYVDPMTGSTVDAPANLNLGSDVFQIYVGDRDLGPTTLGLGGPAVTTVYVGASGDPSQLQNAVDNLESTSNAAMLRGGSALFTDTGVVSLGGTSVNVSLQSGFAIGSIAFNSTLPWDLDYDTLPGEDQFDLYSTAVHEMLHDLGFGFGDKWLSLVDGDNWLGQNVINLLGTGSDVLSGNSHIAYGITGTPLVNGVWQTGVEQTPEMSPSFGAGMRRYLTNTDLAFLSDTYWTTVTPAPEPPVAWLTALGAGLFLMGKARRLRSGGESPRFVHR